uniref:Katanin p60 ATPase-containing subunit A-like 2 n=1 Tax=Cacopsylla melanoneura TaxID=428564 RepID=A0A8D9ARW7_9HEMI
MLQYYLPPVVLESPRLVTELDYNTLAKAMEGYSGSDIKTVCKEVAMERVRETFDTLERMSSAPQHSQIKSERMSSAPQHSQIKSHIKLKRITTQQMLSTLQTV